MDKRPLALIGVTLLIVGLFLPVAMTGSAGVNLLFPRIDLASPLVITEYMNVPRRGIGDGVVIMVLAVIAALLASFGQVRHVLWPGLAALAFVVWKYFQVSGAMDNSRAILRAGDTDIGRGLAASLQTNMLGWIVLAIGALLVIVAGALAWKGGGTSSET